jgi:hypothetical protein
MSRIRKGLLMQAVYTEGNPYDEIRSYILSHDIDMLFIPDRFEPAWPSALGLYPSRFVTDTSCAVIRSVGNQVLKNMDRIILPVGSSIPINSMRVAVYLAQQFKAVVHLVAEGNREKDELQSLQRSYQLLKENTGLEVLCNTLEPGNFRRSLFDYASAVNAGLIVANAPYTTRPGLITRFFKREYPASRHVPVLVVQ